MHQAVFGARSFQRGFRLGYGIFQRICGICTAKRHVNRLSGFDIFRKAFLLQGDAVKIFAKFFNVVCNNHAVSARGDVVPAEIIVLPVAAEVGRGHIDYGAAGVFKLGHDAVLIKYAVCVAGRQKRTDSARGKRFRNRGTRAEHDVTVIRGNYKRHCAFGGKPIVHFAFVAACQKYNAVERVVTHKHIIHFVAEVPRAVQKQKRLAGNFGDNLLQGGNGIGGNRFVQTAGSCAKVIGGKLVIADVGNIFIHNIAQRIDTHSRKVFIRH